MKRSILLASVVSASLVMATLAVAKPWAFSLADTVYVTKNEIRFSDLSKTDLPGKISTLIAGDSGSPGTVQLISRRSLLRKLVTEGMASGVSFSGPSECVIVRTGQSISPDSLRPAIRRILQPFVAVGKLNAPATWFEVELPRDIGASSNDDYEVRLANPIGLEPGRNHLSIELKGKTDSFNFPITVILHQFDETAQAKVKIKRGDSLGAHLFTWRWVDLAVNKQKTDFYGREGLFGVSCSRTLKAGSYLRQSDLKATPVILTGDLVELLVQKGAISVSVRATARQEGSIGQTIPVRNELTKRLVNARVMAPGVVKWRN